MVDELCVLRLMNLQLQMGGEIGSMHFGFTTGLWGTLREWHRYCQRLLPSKVHLLMHGCQGIYGRPSAQRLVRCKLLVLPWSHLTWLTQGQSIGIEFSTISVCAQGEMLLLEVQLRQSGRAAIWTH
mmetsp:Transcript_72853/g.184151  ORF Transcript_72853/g.184151 Transcript_72853/m.184151 type:complete len:126 (-) Transcript_72853:72-449(-)